MSALVLSCKFIAHSYQGVRLNNDQREELDWPPSPARLHQALLSAALTGVPIGSLTEAATKALATLRWLEYQPPPVIAASAISEGSESTGRFRVAIPQNNPAKSDFTTSSLPLAPAMRVRFGLDNQPLQVDYIWQLDGIDLPGIHEQHVSVLADLTAQVRYLGRAEDQIEACLEIKNHLEYDPIAFEKYRPSTGSSDLDLWVAKVGTSDNLFKNHSSFVPARTRKSPATRYLLSQRYAKDAVEPRLPVQVAIFQLMAADNFDGPPLSCDPENGGMWRSRIRQKTVELALECERWDHPDLAAELITGHPPGESKGTGMPHLAFVPVPSVSTHGKADGRVRRMALLGYANPDVEEEASEVYRMLFESLDAETISLDGIRFRLERFNGRHETDRVWCQFIRASKVWQSVTPVAIARKFDVPTHSPEGSRKLTSNERHIRRLSEWSSLLRASLRHIGLPDDVVDKSSILLTPSPLIQNTERAERYRPPGETAVFTHARIEFDQPVRGPLILGDRRYQGYGLLFPS